MSPRASRRSFLAGMSAATSTPFFATGRGSATSCSAGDTPFRLSVITDELTQDFGRALEIASKEFGLGFVELRSLWNKNIIALDEKEIAEVKRLLEHYRLQVTDIASPLFKANLSGGPTPKYSTAEQQVGR